MFTREQYLNRECTHRKYYGQFVNSSTISWVKTRIGKEALKRSTDKHFNDIPLRMWDAFHPHLSFNKQVFSDCNNGSRGFSLSDTVCIAKEAARQICESTDEV